MERIEGSYREDPVVRFLRVVHRAGLRQGAVQPPEESGGERLTHVEVARRAGLSRPSVARYARDLRKTVLEKDALAIRPDSGYALGVDFASAHRARVIATDMNGRILASWPPESPTLAYENTTEALESAKTGIDFVLGRVSALLGSDAEAMQRLIGVGVSVPGPRQFGTANVRTAPWQHLRADEQLKRLLGWSEVEFVAGNDAYLSALAEHLWGAAAGYRHVLYVKWAAGVRAAPIVDGHLYTGAASNAGELAHNVVAEPEEWDEPCRCGRPGCVHSVTCLRTLLAAAGLPEDALAQAVVAQAEEAGRAREALERAARAIGREIAPFIDLLNPELVVIGGPVGSRAYLRVLPELVGSLAEHASANSESVRFVGSSLNTLTAVRGAVGKALLEFGPTYLQQRAEPADSGRRRAGRAHRGTRTPRVPH